MAGYTQEEIADKLGYGRANYTYKENDVSKFGEDEKKTIFDLLKEKIEGLQMEQLFPEGE